MSASYDAAKDPRTGRPVLPQAKQEQELSSAIEEARRIHHEDGIPPSEPPSDEFVENDTVHTKPAAMKAPPSDWDAEQGSDSSEKETEEDQLESEPSDSDRFAPDMRPVTYQVSVENPTIAARDYELEASGVVAIEMYRGGEMHRRVTIEVTTAADARLTIGEANGILLEAGLEALRKLCGTDPEVLRRSLFV